METKIKTLNGIDNISSEEYTQSVLAVDDINNILSSLSKKQRLLIGSVFITGDLPEAETICEDDDMSKMIFDFNINLY